MGDEMSLRSMMRQIVAPIARPIWRRVSARIETRLAPTDARLAAIEERTAMLDGAWRQHVPTFLNAASSVDAFAHQMVRSRKLNDLRLEDVNAAVASCRDRLDKFEANESANEIFHKEVKEAAARALIRLDNNDASIAALWDRIEFVRREILFEMAHGRAKAPSNETATTVPRILNPEKVAIGKSTGALKLNLGCGHVVMSDYVNVDVRDVPGVDVLADVANLPFEPHTISEISSAHLVEHFPQEMLRRRLLPHWFTLLRPGGTLRVVTPDAAVMLANASAGSYSFEDFREAVFGSQDYIGDYHYNLFTTDSLRGLLSEAGFAAIEIPVAGRRNGKCFEFEIVAKKE